ncbi:hypothetical protein PAAG_11541 [Paracoccidioides lutzii Pb01]|uniref:Uncharacterized protein n=1 Tax=Paracoccidioides lutzii (strain ATCC MYA-826 / Pb01) TaxID=502779 RepID=A0A0A2V6J0_PARBA|nr:hypothetical protein PAAG_11541 [Paracoccidioides lutzii Pb01]KGQ01695.1 hypothetical protein PAAG_11541 [Paracoccidioides lutzii Pb01]
MVADRRRERGRIRATYLESTHDNRKFCAGESRRARAYLPTRVHRCIEWMAGWQTQSDKGARDGPEVVGWCSHVSGVNAFQHVRLDRACGSACTGTMTKLVEPPESPDLIGTSAKTIMAHHLTRLLATADDSAATPPTRPSEIIPWDKEP